MVGERHVEALTCYLAEIAEADQFPFLFEESIHQKPHCRVATIQSPRARLVRPWVTVQESRLLVW
jgi:hypothetical protein